jgi:ABC-2 type transport system permease protein
MRPPRRIGWCHARGLWSFYRFGLLRMLRFGLEVFAGPVLSALLFLLVFAIAIGDTQMLAGGLTFQQFLAPGIAMFTLTHSAFSMAAFPLVYDKMEGVLQDVLMSPLGALEVAAGYTLPGVTVGLITGGATLAVAAMVMPLPRPAPGVLVFFALAAGLLFAMLGTIVGVAARKWDQLSTADTFLMLPLAFLSGAFFTLDGLPEIGRTLIAFNPVFYAIDGARYATLGIQEASIATGAAVVLGLNAAVGLLVWRLFASGYRLKP